MNSALGFVLTLLPLTQFPSPPVHKVRLHAYSLSSFTLIGVDTTQIKYSAPLKMTLKHPARFLTQLEQALAKRDTIPLAAFKANFVRFWFSVSYRSGTVQSIYLAQGSSLLIGHRLYKLDDELKGIIRQFIPDGGEYLPERRITK